MTTQAEQLKQKFDAEWGAFRRAIASNPLTGFWCGVILGGCAVYAVTLIHSIL